MDKKKNYAFDTIVVHGNKSTGHDHGATLPPIFQNAAFTHKSAESLSRTFSGATDEPIYTRLGNPTNHALEKRLTELEEGKGAIAMASGMAAIANTCMALLRTGDEFVAGRSLFMSTYVLFTSVFKKYGITARLAAPLDSSGIKAAINNRTRFVYLETIGNPAMDVPDIRHISKTAHDYGIPLIVDNTLATPFLCRPLELGADVVIHSTTKYLGGHGASVGGAVIVGDSFEWDKKRFPDFEPFVQRKGSLALIDKIWREHHINFGTTQSPMDAYLTLLGINTLSLRMERHFANAIKVANFLKGHPKVKWVNYPGLENSPSHATAVKQFGKKGFGALLTFGLADQDTCFRFIDNLKLILNIANLGDCRTMAIHPYSTQYVSFDEATRRNLSITPDMIRLSVGIENPSDICDDIAHALEE